MVDAMQKKALSPVHQWRRQHVLDLEAQMGSLKRLADAADVDASYLSQIKNQTRSMGSAFARRVEQGLGLEEGELSRPPGESGGHVNDERPEYADNDQRLSRVIESWPALTDKQKDEVVRNITGLERSNLEILDAILNRNKSAG